MVLFCLFDCFFSCFIGWLFMLFGLFRDIVYYVAFCWCYNLLVVLLTCGFCGFAGLVWFSYLVVSLCLVVFVVVLLGCFCVFCFIA